MRKREVQIANSGYSDGHIVQRVVESAQENAMRTLLLIIVILLLFGGGGGYYGYSHWGPVGGGGFVGVALLVILILFLTGKL